MNAFKKIVSSLTIATLLLTLSPTLVLADEVEDPAPDLTVTDVYISTEGYLSVDVTNEGTEDVDDDLDGVLEIYIDDMDDPEWTYSWDTLTDQSFLDAGDSSIVQPQVLDEGDVKACIDSTDVVDELDEDDNCMEVSLDSSVIAGR